VSAMQWGTGRGGVWGLMHELVTHAWAGLGSSFGAEQKHKPRPPDPCLPPPPTAFLPHFQVCKRRLGGLQHVSMLCAEQSQGKGACTQVRARCLACSHALCLPSAPPS
jgi:hypothetical protein